jgi:ATP-dependent Clp protease ATP-binding subunit ClpC
MPNLFLLIKVMNQQFGARPLHRAIQKYLEDPLAEGNMNLNVKAGDILVADLDKESQKLKFLLGR